MVNLNMKDIAGAGLNFPGPLEPRNEMNSYEAAYARDVLEIKKIAGEILDYRFEAVRLILAKKTTYTPDFLVVYPTHFQIDEVKGFWRDDARVKIKMAAKLFPWFKFIAVTKRAKKLGGGWNIENI